MSADMIDTINQRAQELLQEDADRILKLIQLQMENLTIPKCPVYEDVLDTQMFGLSREVDFAVRAGLITKLEGKKIMDRLENQLFTLYEAMKYD